MFSIEQKFPVTNLSKVTCFKDAPNLQLAAIPLSRANQFIPHHVVLQINIGLPIDFDYSKPLCGLDSVKSLNIIVTSFCQKSICRLDVYNILALV